MKTIQMEDALQELFVDLHQSGNFADGKEISDAVLKRPPEEILSRYRKEKEQPGFDLMRFYHAHFEKAPERESNYQSDPSLPVEMHIENLWPVLSRQPRAAEKHSTLIHLPHPYVVPGGRFNEIYYWDRYITMLGLQVSGKTAMIESMIDNFTWLIDQYGFIPNGSRTYFLGRSQPPFYALMVKLLAEEKGEAVYGQYLPALEKEHHFWMTADNQLSAEKPAQRRVVRLPDGRVLNRYYDNLHRPRTEMYRDDVELLEKRGEAGARLLLDIRAACESGWDFSSRWCTEPDKLETIHTTDILPVDLNCLLYSLEIVLASAHRETGKDSEYQRWQSLADERRTHINDLFWDAGRGYYFDYDHVARQRTARLSLAGVFPLFLHIADNDQAKRCAAVLEAEFLSPGGLTTTTFDSGQQWDAPNGWAPLQWVAIQGLRNYGLDDLANTIKKRWTDLNIKVYRNTGKLVEKYNVVDTTLESGGGEYPVQDGFGWTNGVLLRLLSEK